MGQSLKTNIQSRSPIIFFLAALLLHSIIMFLYINPQFKKFVNSQEKQEVKIKLRPKIISQFKKQIVHTKESDNKNIKDAKYLSHSDNFFKKETKSKNVNPTNDGAKGRIKARDLINQFTKKKSKTVQRDKSKGKHRFSFNPLNQTPKDESRVSKTKKGSATGEKGKTGINSSSDHLEKLELADFTQVNTLKYKYYGYFHRIRKRLEAHWGKSLENKVRILFHKNSRLPAEESYLTQLTVSMNTLGEIQKIHVRADSGIQELDDAAIEAFNDAGPFPNPPKGLIKDGKVKIKWGFVVKN